MRQMTMREITTFQHQLCYVKGYGGLMTVSRVKQVWQQDKKDDET